MYVSIIYLIKLGENANGKICETIVLHSFLFHFKYYFIPSIPTYKIIIIIDIFYSGHTQVTARHNWGGLLEFLA